MVTRPAVGGRALRAIRSAHERRECARCARERITSVVGSEAAGGDRLTSMRCCRTSCMQARRCSLRLQSREAAAVRDPPAADAAAHLPGAAQPSRCPPLTLFAQWARAAVANAGRIDHAQTAIGLIFAALEDEVAARLDSAASHQAGTDSAEAWMVTALIGVTAHSSSMQTVQESGFHRAGEGFLHGTGYDRSWDASHERRIGTTCFACMACR
jgi:hypothetical protein